MKPAAFDYVPADSTEQALSVLAEHGDDAKVMAGGQSLVPMLNMRLAQPDVLIDVGAVSALREVSRQDGAVRYGAAVTHARIEDGAVPDAGAGLMAAAASGIGYRAVRNRGTIGGSMAHADASAEWPVVLAALGATVHVMSARGSRDLPAASFIEGFFTSALEGDEMITAVEVPLHGPDTTWGYVKFARKEGEFAESLAVAVLHWAADRIAGAELWLGAAKEVPLAVRLEDGELTGAGSAPGKERLARALSELLGQGGTPEDRYRLNLHATTLSRAVRQAVDRRSANGAAD